MLAASDERQRKNVALIATLLVHSRIQKAWVYQRVMGQRYSTTTQGDDGDSPSVCITTWCIPARDASLDWCDWCQHQALVASGAPSGSPCSSLCSSCCSSSCLTSCCCAAADASCCACCSMMLSKSGDLTRVIASLGLEEGLPPSSSTASYAVRISAWQHHDEGDQMMRSAGLHSCACISGAGMLLVQSRS